MSFEHGTNRPYPYSGTNVTQLRSEFNRLLTAYEQSEQERRAALAEVRRLGGRVAELSVERDGLNAQVDHLKAALVTAKEENRALKEQLKSDPSRRLTGALSYGSPSKAIAKSSYMDLPWGSRDPRPTVPQAMSVLYPSTDEQAAGELRDEKELTASLHERLHQIALENRALPMLNQIVQKENLAADKRLSQVLYQQLQTEAFDPVCLSQIFTRIKDWCRQYSQETRAMDKFPIGKMRSLLNSAMPSSMVNEYLADRNTRHLMIARYICEQVTIKAWRPAMLKGFDVLPEQTRLMSESQNKLSGGAMGSDKAACYVMQRDAVAAMREHPEYDAHIRLVSGRLSRDIFQTVSVLLTPHSERARSDLRWLLELTFATGGRLLATTSTFRFDFIKASKNSYFNPDTMEVLEHRSGRVSMEMAASARPGESTVAFCVTPVIVQTEQVSESITPKVVGKAQVALTGDWAQH